MHTDGIRVDRTKWRPVARQLCVFFELRPLLDDVPSVCICVHPWLIWHFRCQHDAPSALSMPDPQSLPRPTHPWWSTIGRPCRTARCSPTRWRRIRDHGNDWLVVAEVEDFVRHAGLDVEEITGLVLDRSDQCQRLTSDKIGILSHGSSIRIGNGQGSATGPRDRAWPGGPDRRRAEERKPVRRR